MIPYTLDNLFGMAGRAVVVVGGTSGIGLEIAGALLDLGAQVAVIGRTEPKCRSAREFLQQRSADARVYQADVVDAAALEGCFADIYQAFGKIDGLVYSAGMNQIQELESISQEDFDRVMDVNFKGLVLCSRFAGKYMLELGFGSMVSISSLSAIRGKRQYTAYAASKAAITGFTRALAVEWIQKGVRVNCVAPGLVVTDINRKEIEAHPDNFKRRVATIPRGRAGEPSSLVGPVVALLSNATAHMVGQTIYCDGGISIGDNFLMTQD